MPGDLHRSARDDIAPIPAGGTSPRRARAGLAEAARSAAHYLADLPTGTGQSGAGQPGEYITRALLAQARWGHVLAYSIACERLVNGTTWAAIAQGLGQPEPLVRGRYEEFVDQLAAGAEHPSWLPRIGGVQVTAPGEIHLPADAAALEDEAAAR